MQSKAFSRYLLKTLKQRAGESQEQYLNSLKILAKDCMFRAVCATQYKDESIRDSFVNFILFNCFRRCLFELKDLDHDTTFKPAGALEIAHKMQNFMQNPVM